MSGRRWGSGCSSPTPGSSSGWPPPRCAFAGLLLLADYVLVRMPNDEVFDDQFVSQSVRPAGSATGDTTFNRTFTHNRPDATYHISFAWEVVREPGPLPAPQPDPFGAIDEIPEETARTNLDKINHIVVVMLENRSFDHLLGYLHAREGRTDVNGLTGEDPVGIEVRPLTDTVFDLDPPHRLRRSALAVIEPGRRGEDRQVRSTSTRAEHGQLPGAAGAPATPT